MCIISSPPAAVTSWTRQRRSACPTTAPSATSSSRFWGFLWPAATCFTPTWRTCNRCQDLRFTSRWLARLFVHRMTSWTGWFFFSVMLISCLCFILQITLSYGMFENKSNIINLKGAFPVEEDPSRWENVLCLKGNSTSFYTSKSVLQAKKSSIKHFVSSFSKPAAYVTHNATWPMSDITRGNVSNCMRLPLVPQKALYYFPYKSVMWNQETSSGRIKNVS